MSKGTILYVGNYELPDKNAAAHRVMANGKIFRALGWRVAYLGVVRDTEHFSGARQSDYSPDIYEEAYPVRTKAWVDHLVNTSNVRSVIEKYGDVRMVILYNVPLITLKRVKRALRGTKIKVCYDCTEWNKWAEGSLVKRLYKQYDASQIERRIGRIADGLIVISRRMEKQYSGQCAMVKIPPLVDTSDAIWNQERMPHDRFEFCFAGTVDNKESLDKIVTAFAQLERTDTLLRIIGVRKEDFLSAHPELSGQVSALADRIVFMGRLTHEETVRYVLSCDTYIFIRESTLRNEAGFPTKFVEAYTSGAPIITTDVSDIGEYMREDRGILLSSGDGDVLAAMRASVENKTENCRRLSDAFDYRSYTDKVGDWIEKVLK